MRFGSLFAGIGGMDLGLERAGMTCDWQVEIDDYATKVLEKHWPRIRRWRDVRDFPPEPVDDWRIDAIAAGFPCQDITSSGKRAGIWGGRSSLFFEVVRIVRVLRPSIVILENVSDLLVRGMGTVLGEMAALGFNSWWDCFPAACLGIPQRRWRTFVVSYAPGVRFEAIPEWLSTRKRSFLGSHHDGLDEAERQFEACAGSISGADYGLPGWVDRIRTLGNAVVPQVAEWIGRRILEADFRLH